MFFEFLQEFAKLSHAEQKVFIFCLKNCPSPRKYTGDLQRIISGTSLARVTVYHALVNISTNPTLRKVVCYIQSDIKSLIQQEYCTTDALDGGLDMGRSEDTEQAKPKPKRPEPLAHGVKYE